MRKERMLLVLLLPMAILAATACNTRIVRGSGDLITETRQVSGFNRIDLSGSGEVIVTQNGSESLSIETDDNVMEHVRAEVVGRTLQIGFKEGVNLITPSRLVFSVDVDDLTGLAISGSGDVEVDMLEADRLEAIVSGSGEIQIGDLRVGEVNAEISGSGEIGLAGDAASQEVTISGSGKYLAGDLCSARVKVSVSGSGDATVCATETLDSNISGSGSVDYYGRPSINSSDSGSGRLNSLGEK
jgi:hypothetical protein